MLNLRAALAYPLIYRTFSSLSGADRGRKKLVSDHIRPRTGDRILDIGCGPADILGYLPNVRYAAFDSSEQYIADAKRRWGDLGAFTCGTVTEATVERSSVDIVLALGVIHHLDDQEALKLFQVASSALRPGGRLITLDGAYVDGQSPVARYLLSKDRGQFVRSPAAYEALAAPHFVNVKTTIDHHLMLIPYTHFIMECLVVAA